ncbi:MAG: thioredoxin family protein [Patescibacteria group bacterium]
MNNTKPIFIILAILVVAGLGIYGLSKPATEEKDVAMEKEKLSEVAATEEPETIMKKGSYETYSSEKLSLASTNKVVLFFRASWCPTCRALDSDIRSNLESIPENLIILDVDYDNSTALKQKYGITRQHTLVQVDASGVALNKWTGSPTLLNLISKVK